MSRFKVITEACPSASGASTLAAHSATRRGPAGLRCGTVPPAQCPTTPDWRGRYHFVSVFVQYYAVSVVFE